MFKEFYKKDIEHTPVNTQLQAQLREQLFSPTNALEQSSPKQSVWQQLITLFQTRTLYSSVVGVAMVFGFIALFIPVHTADATEAPMRPIQVIVAAVFEPKVLWNGVVYGEWKQVRVVQQQGAQGQDLEIISVSSSPRSQPMVIEAEEKCLDINRGGGEPVIVCDSFPGNDLYEMTAQTVVYYP